jgi:hypothetical protein
LARRKRQQRTMLREVDSSMLETWWPVSYEKVEAYNRFVGTFKEEKRCLIAAYHLNLEPTCLGRIRHWRETTSKGMASEYQKFITRRAREAESEL